MLIVQRHVKELKELSNKYGSDKETAHYLADDILLEALIELGFSELASAFNQAKEDCGGFWYA